MIGLSPHNQSMLPMSMKVTLQFSKINSSFKLKTVWICGLNKNWINRGIWKCFLSKFILQSKHFSFPKMKSFENQNSSGHKPQIKFLLGTCEETLIIFFGGRGFAFYQHLEFLRKIIDLETNTIRMSSRVSHQIFSSNLSSMAQFQSLSFTKKSWQ